VVGGKGRCVLYMCSMVRCSMPSVSSEGRKGGARMLHMRYISSPHLVPKGVGVGTLVCLLGWGYVSSDGRW
jgi:hypothetical protein